MGGSSQPDRMTSIQDRVSWAKPDARARLGLARDFYMPGSTLRKNHSTGEWEFVGGDFRTYEGAGGALWDREDFDPLESRGQEEALGLLDEGDPYHGLRRDQVSDLTAGTRSASQQEMGEMGGRNLASNPFSNMSMVGGNPYLDAMYDRGAGKVTEQFQKAVMPELTGTNIMAGKAGGSQHLDQAGMAQRNLANELGSLAADVYGKAYETDMDRASTAYEAERGRQSNAAQASLQRSLGLLPQYGELRGQEFGDADTWRDLGLDRRELARFNADRRYANRDRAFQFQEQQPFQFAALQDTATSGTGQLTQPAGSFTPSPYSQAIGGMMAAPAVAGVAGLGGGA